MEPASASNGEDRAFQRKRLEQFGLAGAGLAGLGLLFRMPKVFVGGHGPDASLAFHIAAVAICLGLFLLCRRVDLSVRALRVLDVVATMATANALGWMGASLIGPVRSPHALDPRMMVLLVLTFIVFARAALVPSSARRTLLVTVACGTGLIPVMYRSPMDPFGTSVPGIVGALVGALMWWTLTTTLATIASSIIYGLRRDVKAAREFGQYQLLEKIGEGGMGAVYRASHRMLRRDTALKLLPPTRSSAAAVARFEREVRLTAQLRHPNTVTIFDYGRTPDGVFYYTMELLEGATLEEIVRSTGPMPPGRVAWILRQVAGALAEAHDLGLVHRDVKPSNIMLGMRGGQPDVAKVLDFGLAHEQLDAAPTDLLGTPQYMSPEAIVEPERVSPASDLYSLGAVAYYLLAGAPPFEARTIVEMCTQHMYSQPASLSDRGTVPPEIEAVVLALLAKEPAVRPASATALLERLERLPPFPWSEADARSWWREHGARIRPRIHQAPSAREQTLDVDLARRVLAEAETLAPVSVSP